MKVTVEELREFLEDCEDDADIHIHCSGAFTEVREMSEGEVEWNTGEKENVVELR